MMKIVQDSTRIQLNDDDDDDDTGLFKIPKSIQLHDEVEDGDDDISSVIKVFSEMMKVTLIIDSKCVNHNDTY